MNFKKYFDSQLRLHPSMQASDVLKLCFQAAFGAEHLLIDEEGARRYFDAEFAAVLPKEAPLFEMISDGVSRIDLGAWKASGMPQKWLFNMFLASAKIKEGGKERFFELADEAERCIGLEMGEEIAAQWLDLISEYKKSEPVPVHHSDEYRRAEKPSYRVVDSSFLSVLPILKAASGFDGEQVKVIAIDGRAASGKSTLASLLSKVLDCDAVHTDDFFLPKSLRNRERLSEAGGNLHYERFSSEILPFICKKGAFEYGVFDCSVMSVKDRRKIKESEWRIVEGSYSHHPKFGNYATVRVFVSVDEREQIARIKKRNGDKMAEIFSTRWIPMEEKYFNAFDIKSRSDVNIDTTDF